VDKTIAAEWVKRLRSGEYPQTTGSLEHVENSYSVQSGQRQVGYCCLGVLSLMASEEGIVERWVTAYGDVYYGTEGTFQTYSAAALPEAVQEWSGIKTAVGERSTPEGDWKSSLSDLNDGQKKTFAEIADVIEAEYERL
jgi:hypothetical protein